jgi:thymidylate kinase
MNSVIVLEALDGVGKSTVAKIVAQKLGAVVYKPSGKIKFATNKAIELPYGSEERSDAIRNTLTMMSDEIKEISESYTVIVDRFYASWASAEVGAGNMKIRNLSIEDWPRDLIKPKLSVHLRVDEEERMRRIGTRDFQNQREIKLGNDHAYRYRVLRGLTRLTDCDVDNTFRSPEETAAMVAQLYKEKQGVQIRTKMICA